MAFWQEEAGVEKNCVNKYLVYTSVNGNSLSDLPANILTPDQSAHLDWQVSRRHSQPPARERKQAELARIFLPILIKKCFPFMDSHMELMFLSLVRIIKSFIFNLLMNLSLSCIWKYFST